MTFNDWRILLLLFVPATLLAWVWLRDRMPVLGLGAIGGSRCRRITELLGLVASPIFRFGFFLVPCR